LYTRGGVGNENLHPKDMPDRHKNRDAAGVKGGKGLKKNEKRKDEIERKNGVLFRRTKEKGNNDQRKAITYMTGCRYG